MVLRGSFSLKGNNSLRLGFKQAITSLQDSKKEKASNSQGGPTKTENNYGHKTNTRWSHLHELPGAVMTTEGKHRAEGARVGYGVGRDV